MRKLIPLTLAAAAAILSPARAGAEDKPVADAIRMTINAPGANQGEIVRGGIPFARSAGLTDTSRMGLWRRSADGRDEWIPAQTSVLSRHGATADTKDAPARWVLAQFPQMDGSYALRTDMPGDVRRPDDVAKDGSEAIEVDTGALRFRVPKNQQFAPLQGLRVRVPDGKGGTLERDAVTGPGLDISMTLIQRLVAEAGQPQTRDVTFRLSESVINDVAVEENGPWRSVIRMRGTFQAENGRPLLSNYLGYTIRIWSDRGSDQVRVFFTLENNGPYGPTSDSGRTTSKPTWIRMRNLELVVPTTMTGKTLRGTTADGSWTFENGASGDDFRLLQWHKVERPEDRATEQRNFHYSVRAATSWKDTGEKNADGTKKLLLQGNQLATGARSGGGFRVDDGATSITTAVRHFWQSYPKAISFEDGALRVELFPKEPGERWPADINPVYGDAYEFEGGRHKTYEVMLAFGAGSSVENGTAAELGKSVSAREKAFQNPAAFVVDPAYVQRTNSTFGAFALPEFPIGNASLAEAQAHHVRMQKGQVDVKFCDAQGADGEIPPASLIEQRETRGHALPAAIYDLDLYGYMSFGDLPHDLGFSSGHHDWVRGLFLNWLRYGKREFLDVGVEMLRHRYDIDQYHCQERADPTWKWYNGFQRFELGFHGARLADFHPHGEATSCPQATWLEGLLLAYAVTGDPRAMDTARENAEAFVNYFTVSGTLDRTFVRGALEYFGQLSAMSVGVHQLLTFYEFTGERRYYDVAMQVFKQGLLKAEEYYGNRGFFSIKHNQLQVWPVVRLVQPLITAHRLSGDPEALAMLVRILRFFTENAYDGGTVDDEGRYLPLTLPYEWVLEDGQLVAHRWFIPYNFMTCDGFAYAYRASLAAGADPKEIQPLLDWARHTYRDATIFYQAPVHQPVGPDFYSQVSYAPRQYPNSETKNGVWLLWGGQFYLELEQYLSTTKAEGLTLKNDDWFALRRRVLDDLARRRTVRGWEPKQPQAPKDLNAGVPERRIDLAGKGTDGGLLKKAEPNYPTPDAIMQRARVVSMDDRDAVRAGDWQVTQNAQANNGSMLTAQPSSRNTTVTFNVPVEREGQYYLYLWWPETPGASSKTSVDVTHRGNGGNTDRFHVAQNQQSNRWRLLCPVAGGPNNPVSVRFSTEGADGTVIADAIRLEPIETPQK